jgi:alkanesulfonate monooxygenase SsuD/methylene tetrahydromethanopterin reductase-like flavin-dependent oxidoreductase (luciferase family)
MELGAFVNSHPGIAASHARLLEEHGFTHAWFGDLPMNMGDIYICMALAAASTEKIKLGAGIAAASMRPAPVTAHSIATVNAISPGRVILGLGSGHFGRRLLGLPPNTLKQFKQQVQTVAGLLADGEATYETDGLRRRIRFFDRGLQSIRLEPKIPLYVAASSTKSFEVAGELADGAITLAIAEPDRLAALLRHARTGAQRAGRPQGEFPCIMEAFVWVLGPGETLTTPHIVEIGGSFVIGVVKHALLNPEWLPESLLPIHHAYARTIRELNLPQDELHLKLWEGFASYQLLPEEHRLLPKVGPDAIRSVMVIGTPDEVVERLRALGHVGLTGLALHVPLEPNALAQMRELISQV